MSNEQYNVFIVPHAHQDALVKAIKEVTRLPGAAVKAAVSKRAGNTAPKSKRSAKAPSAPSSAPKSKHHGETPREWSVLFRDKRYNVIHLGPNCGYRIDREGTVVWIGARSANGEYETHSTSLAHEMLDPLLRLVKTGDDRDAAKRGERAAPTKKEGKAKAATAGPPTMRAAEVSETTKPASVKPASVKPASVKPASSKAAKPSSKHVAETVVEAPTPVSSKEPKPSSKHVTEAAKPASEKAAKPSSKRAKEPSKAPAREVNDETIFKEMKRKLVREKDADPEESLETLKRIWLHGGREATLAWMSGEGSKFKSVVNAFDKWAESHPAEVKAILAKPHEAPTSAKAA